MAQTPELQSLISEAIQSRLLDLFVGGPGRVVSYTAAKRTAEIQPATRRPIPNDDGTIAFEELAPVKNVPVIFPGSALFDMHYPLAAGDGVLLCYVDLSPAAWRRLGRTGDPPDVRAHGSGYPVAIPGWATALTLRPDSDTSIGTPGGLRLHFGLTSIDVGAGSSYVALATLVAGELVKIAASLASVPAPTPYVIGSVASTVLKSD